MIVITFKPGVSYPFIKQSLESFNNKVVHASSVFREDILILRKELIKEPDDDEKIDIAKR